MPYLPNLKKNTAVPLNAIVELQDVVHGLIQIILCFFLLTSLK